ncbi:MAG: serine hydrolase [Gaiellaceae bacterium]
MGGSDAHRLDHAGGTAWDDLATGSDSAARVSGHELGADGAVPVQPLVVRAFAPAGTSMVSAAGDMLRFAALHLADPVLATLRPPQPAPGIRAWLDGWCLGWAWFDWKGDHVYGWESVINGERTVLRLVPERHAEVVLMTTATPGVVPLALHCLMQALFEIGVPPLRLDSEPDAPAISRDSPVCTPGPTGECRVRDRLAGRKLLWAPHSF